MQMASATENSGGQKTATVDGFDLRETAGGAWEVYNLASGVAVRITGKLLTQLSKDEAIGAIHLLKAEAIKPDERP